MEWTTGIAALPDGFVTLQQRYYSKRWDGVPESHWRSEVFRFEGGEYLGSVALDRQWVILDFDQNQGVLMASNHPFPLFITIQLADLMGF
jgi:hypothetical protein